ncbi:hypothetical protein RHGRI_028549 [Rhododendron griersonianum]|uniref:HXXXD-type acyl-transferase family protein n=1 Tax=Rhododendron griersonianum TaxID=479676 RepID=A0AAV6IGW8_9ERIC|nr:hypothetical protein RHGRI_028549 [Rhododendron griersonianum]
MALQISLFPNAGFCIGNAAQHAVFDGKSIAMFMHSWASICKRGGESTLSRELTPIYDRTVVKDPSDLEKAYLNGWPADNGANDRSLEFRDMKAPPDAMLGTFQLTKANIESIKKWVEAKWQEIHTEEKPAFHPSTFAITSCFVDADTNKCMEEDGVAIAAWVIGEAVGGLADGVLIGAKELIPNYLSRLKEGGLVSIAGSPRFELYKTDFGWGRPSKVEMVSIDKTGAFHLSDSRDGNGGVEIGVVLKKHESEAFASLFASGLEYHQVHKS